MWTTYISKNPWTLIFNYKTYDGYSFLWRTALFNELIRRKSLPEPCQTNISFHQKCLLVWPAQICFTPHCTIWFFSDAQLPDTLRVVYTNLARASQFWTFWYRILDGPSGGRDISGGQTPERTTRQTASVDERTTPYNLPTTVDRNRGKTKNNTPVWILGLFVHHL